MPDTSGHFDALEDAANDLDAVQLIAVDGGAQPHPRSRAAPDHGDDREVDPGAGRESRHRDLDNLAAARADGLAADHDRLIFRLDRRRAHGETAASPGGRQLPGPAAQGEYAPITPVDIRA